MIGAIMISLIFILIMLGIAVVIDDTLEAGGMTFLIIIVFILAFLLLFPTNRVYLEEDTILDLYTTETNSSYYIDEEGILKDLNKLNYTTQVSISYNEPTLVKHVVKTRCTNFFGFNTCSGIDDGTQYVLYIKIPDEENNDEEN